MAFNRTRYFLSLATLHLSLLAVAFAADDIVDPARHAPVIPSTTQRKTAPPIKLDPVDLNHPPREYVEYTQQGWHVFVEKELDDTDPNLALKAVSRLDTKLKEIITALPAAALPDLRKVKIFLLYGPPAAAGGRKSGLQYFAKTSAKFNPWLDPRMERSIVIFSAANYISLSDLWALKSITHEFGHAHHLEHWPENRADIYDAWDKAMKAGRFKTVHPEDKEKPIVNYAAQNHLEYFAELTTMYFARANYFPYDRAGLKAYDPDGYAMIEKLWGVTSEKTKAP